MTTPFPFVANTVLNASQLNAITTLPINARTASYTLVVGDVGQRVQMTNASATTITVNTGIFSQGDTVWIQNLGSGTCTITSGTCTVSTASSLALAQYGGGTLVFQSASAATFFSQQSATYGTATGGTETDIVVGGLNYKLLAFSSDGTLTITRPGLFDVLLVAGGGGAGGGVATTAGAGGGGGGVIGLASATTVYLSANQAITIGAGGVGSATIPTNGSGTYVGTVVSAAGGGYGGANDNDIPGVAYRSGRIGGSGGGSANLGQTSTAIFTYGGNAGGASGSAATCASGGGGLGSAGGAGSGTTGGSGGNGSDITAFTTTSLVVSAGGGGGGSVTGGTAGTGGVAGKTTGTGNNGVNKGAAGGGTFGASAGGNGAAGVAYIRFKT